MIRPSHRRELFATSDPDRAHETLRAMYGSDARMLRSKAGRDGEAGLAISYLDTGDFQLAEVDLRSGLQFVNQGNDSVTINTVLDGTMELESAGRANRYGTGDVFIATQPDINWPGWTDGSRIHAVTLSAALLRSVADDGPEPGTARLPFTDVMPRPGGRQRWRKAALLVEELLVEPDLATPLVVGSAGRLLAATALSLFPTTTAEPERLASRDAHPTALHRAITFIEAHPDAPVTVGDIARAAYVSPRAVQLAFRRHLDTTPMNYLRRVRLDRARADLQIAEPGDGTTVTAVAARWGFGSPSRFAADYRRAYGRLPQETLRGNG